MTIRFTSAGSNHERTFYLDGNIVSWDHNGGGEHCFDTLTILRRFASGEWQKLPDAGELEGTTNAVTSQGDSIDTVAGNTAKTGAIASDGGSSTYYDIELPKWLIARVLERYEDGHAYIKTEELIEIIFQSDFDASNAFKSLVRLWGTYNGAGKAGNSLSYERKKIEYSVNKLQQRFDRRGAAQ